MRKEQIRRDILDLAVQYMQCLKEESENAEKKYIPASGKDIGVEELVNMIDASLDMWLTAGRFNDEFEQGFARKLNVKHALSVNSGSSANLVAFTALTSPKLGKKSIKRGDEVITVAAGFPTTVNPIIQNNCIPVFIDCEIGSYNICIDQIEAAITPRTKAIFLAHTLGNMYEMDKIMDLAERYGLWVIEDSCDALGAKYQGRYAGTVGHIGTFSFYPAHHITMGEGGAVVTNNSLLHRIMMSFRDWGRDCVCPPGNDGVCKKRFDFKLGNLPRGYDHKYTYSHIGYNLKITDWQAAIAVAQMQKLDVFLERRKQNAHKLLSELDSLQDYLILPSLADDCEPSWFGFLISVRDGAPFTKQELVEYLEGNGVGTRQLFAGNILRQPMITTSDVTLKIGASDLIHASELSEEHYSMLPNTEFIMNNTFWVGVAQNVNLNDMTTTARLVKAFVESKIDEKESL